MHQFISWKKPGDIFVSHLAFISMLFVLLVPRTVAASSIQVLEAAARAGSTYGARLGLDGCAHPADLALSGSLTMDETACNSITASGDVSGTVTFTAGSGIVLADGFSVAAGSTFVAAIDPAVTGDAYVEDRLPEPVDRYVASFFLDPTNLTIPETEQFDHLAGYAADGTMQFKISVTYNQALDEDRIFVEARLDNGSTVSTQGSSEFEIPAQWNALEIDWKAASAPGTSDGAVVLCVNDTGSQTSCTSLFHDHAGRVSRVRWGARAVDAGTTGSIDLDDFAAHSLPVQAFEEILDVTGDGTNSLSEPWAVALDDQSHLYIAGLSSHNVFDVAPDGTIEVIIDSSGDGSSNFGNPSDVAVDALGNVYVTNPSAWQNVFKVRPDGVVFEVLDASGDGQGNGMTEPKGLAVDSHNNLYVSALQTDNVFQVTPAGQVTEVLDGSGDGAGNALVSPWSLAVDADDNLFVAGWQSDNVFKRTPGGEVTEILDFTGDGAGNGMDQPSDLTVDAAGNVYVTGNHSRNAFRISPSGMVTEIIDTHGDGGDGALIAAGSVAVDGNGRVYVGDGATDKLFRIAPDGIVSMVADFMSGGGVLEEPSDLALDDSGIYVAGIRSNNVVRLQDTLLFSDDFEVGNLSRWLLVVQ